MKKALYLLLSAVLLCSLVALSFPIGSCQLPQEGVLTLSDYGPITLDPAISTELTSHSYIMQLFSGLACLDENLKPAPDIAQRWGVSDDGMTYTFFLRRGVKFHDGSEVKAEDFKYSWERACDPETGSHTAAIYLSDIVGAKEVLAGRAEEISGVEVIDDYTLRVTIDAPKPYFLAKLTYPTAFVVDEANVETGAGWWRNPNGTGPFKLKEWKKDIMLVLERNELFYGEQAKVSHVVFLILAGVPIRMYEKGDIDVTSVSASDIDRVRDEAGPLHRELMVTPELSFYYIGFNTTKPPFDDVDVRRAFCHAVDKDKIVSLTFKGMINRSDGILPPGMPGYNEDLQGLTYDVDKAREFIAASRYEEVSNLPPITITTMGWGGYIPGDLAAVIEEWRHNLGVEVEVRELEPEVFLYHIKEEKDEMFSFGWIADYPDPQDFLEILFHSDSGQNYSQYSDPAMDALLEEAGVERDDSHRMELYQQAEQMLVDDVACLPLWFGQSYILVKPYVGDYILSPLGFPLLNKVYIKPN